MTKTPEQEARETIDKMLDKSGWDVPDVLYFIRWLNFTFNKRNKGENTY